MAPTQQNLAWSVVGQGAIGLLAACRLHLHGNDVSLWLREPAPLSVNFSTLEHQQYRCDFLPTTGPIQHSVVAVKAYAVASCLAQLKPYLSHHAQLIISHNGMPDLDSLRQFAEVDQGIWFLSTSHGALRKKGTIQHTGLGQSILSPLNQAAALETGVVVDAMQVALGPVTLTENIMPALWRKLAVNAVINPLTTLLNCRNGALADPHYARTIHRLVTEVCTLAELEGIALPFDTTLQHVYHVIQATANNYSSMHQDRAQSRPLELAAITGFILKTAAKHHLTMSENHAIWQALSAD